jgi:hypothetical protein
MNERIKQLAEQARIKDHWSIDEARYLTNYLDEKKFAELIVRECTKVIVHGGYWSGGPLGPKRQCTPPEIAQMIKEHFGVEE